MYKLLPNSHIDNKPCAILNKETCVIIPFSDDNTDYQEYLKWLAEGNTPEPADE